MNMEDLEVGQLFTLSVEDRQKVIQLGTDQLFQEILITAQITNKKASVLLNDTLVSIEEHIKFHKENDNFELCYYFTEVFWETNKRLQDLRERNKSNVFV
jgi:hypothetical protein